MSAIRRVYNLISTPMKRSFFHKTPDAVVPMLELPKSSDPSQYSVLMSQKTLQSISILVWRSRYDGEVAADATMTFSSDSRTSIKKEFKAKSLAELLGKMQVFVDNAPK